MVNHVNLFDPFVLYTAIPQYVRGWELESHFKIPAYGWLMKRFGNVPVPDVRRPSDLKRMWRLTQDAIDGGTSLIIFPEGKRTRDGHVCEFQDGGFRVAQQLGIPIVPVSLVGSFQHHRTGHWMLWPAVVTVILHDTIDTTQTKKSEVAALRDHVRAVISDTRRSPPEATTSIRMKATHSSRYHNLTIQTCHSDRSGQSFSLSALAKRALAAQWRNLSSMHRRTCSFRVPHPKGFAGCGS